MLEVNESFLTMVLPLLRLVKNTDNVKKCENRGQLLQVPDSNVRRVS